MSVLQVGPIEPSLANALAAKYEVLQLPDDSSRATFVAEHGASVIAIVCFGPSGSVEHSIVDDYINGRPTHNARYSRPSDIEVTQLTH